MEESEIDTYTRKTCTLFLYWLTQHNLVVCQLNGLDLIPIDNITEEEMVDSYMEHMNWVAEALLNKYQGSL